MTEQLEVVDCKNMEGHSYCLLFGDTSASVSRERQKLRKIYETTAGKLGQYFNPLYPT
jgi:hypothetical protein